MPKILEEKWRLDEFYNGYIVDPLTNLSRNGLWKGFDVGVIDGIVNGIGHFVDGARQCRRAAFRSVLSEATRRLFYSAH